MSSNYVSKMPRNKLICKRKLHVQPSSFSVLLQPFRALHKHFPIHFLPKMASRTPEEDESDEPELPLTQPLGSQDEELILPFQPKRHYWGYLEAQQDYYSNYELRNESWKCGRGFTLDCTLKGPQIPAEVLSTISRTHFVIELVVDEEDINGVYATLTDQSTGGTYVNGERVSKKSRPLIHGDMISITFPSNQAFRFYFMTPSQNPNTAEYINRKTLLFNLPSQVQEKYLVGKRLGAGSGGVVLQAFQRLPDGSVSNDKVAMKVIEKGVKGSKRFIKEGRILKGKRRCLQLFSILE